jgi:hypothetical protein
MSLRLWDPRINRGAVPRFGFDFQRSADQRHALSHAREAEPGVWVWHGVWLEATAIVFYDDSAFDVVAL